MRIAYQIGVHGKERQFKWLFDAIYNPHDLFVIHIDRKTPEAAARAMRETAGNRPNVYFSPQHSVIYSEWAMCEMELDAIRYLCENHKDWQYFINLTGHDYPLKARDQIVTELSKNPRQNFVQIIPLDTLPPYFRRRINWYCFRFGDRLIRTPLPHFVPRNIRVEWHGSGSHIITREFCEWLSKADAAQDCVRFLRHVKVPNEFLMQTLIMNSPFVGILSTSYKRYIRWGNHVPHPVTMTMAHHDELIACDDLFARKFDENVDSAILYALARHIGAEPVPPRNGTS